MHDFNEIKKGFFPDQKDITVQPLGSGNINDTYRLKVKNTSFLLQRINHQVFSNPQTVVENQQKIYQHIKDQHPSWVLPQLFSRPNGTLLYQDANGNSWRLVEFLEGSYAYEAVKNIGQVAAAALKMGQFIGALNQKPLPEIEPTIPDFHNLQRRFKYLEEVVDNDPEARLQAVKKEVDWIGAQMQSMPNYHDLGLPQRLVHNDPKIGNYLFDAEGQCICVIDWDTVMPGTILTDFGDMVRTMVATASEDEADLKKIQINLDYYQALVRNFLAPLQKVLTPIEKKYFSTGPAYIILEQSIRFLADYLAGDVYYKIEYPEHNLVRTRNQIALMIKLYEQEAKILPMIDMALGN